MSFLPRLYQLSSFRNAIIISQRHCRLISTSSKKSDTATVAATKRPSQLEGTVDEKNWVSWGWEVKDKEADRNAMKASFFFSVTLCIVFASFYLAYTPDNFQIDWAQREAFLELRRREAAGLPLVDPNYVDPAKVTLPSDEELGDTEIII